MNEQEKDLEKCEQDLFETLMALILYLNSNGMNLDGIKEMIDMKIKNAFEMYEAFQIKEKFDKEHKSEKWSWKDD